MTKQMTLEGNVAIVTGGASGIGLAIVERLHGKGASVVVADRSGAQTEVAARLGGRALAVQADVTSSAEIQAMFDITCAQFGGIDILCNNAGIDGGINLVADTSEELFDRILNTNLRSVFLCMKYGIPLMKQRGGGAIVNTSSLASLISSRGLGVYGASKAAINQLTRSAAAEYATDGIRVNAICPGGTATPLVQELFGNSPDAGAASIANTPMGRFASTSEVADAVLFLASGQSSYITGVTLPLDGGYSVV